MVVTFHPCLSGLSKLLHKHLLWLYTDEDVKRVFTSVPFVSFQLGYNLRNHLVRAKVHPIEWNRGSFKCAKKACKTCLNAHVTSTFKASIDKKKYKINHDLCCDDQCIVYLLTCKICGIQYVRQTTNMFNPLSIHCDLCPGNQ